MTHSRIWGPCMLVSLLMVLGALPKQARASEPAKFERPKQIESLGFPRAWKPYLAPMAAWDKSSGDDQVAPDLTLGVYKDLFNPLMAPFGVAGEGYVRYPGGNVDGGFRLLGASRFFFTQFGLDYALRSNSVDFMVGLTIPLRRGGPLGRGDLLRAEWLPGRNNSLQLGLIIPIFQPHMGHTRPHQDHVTLPQARGVDRSTWAASPVLGESLAQLEQSMRAISQFTTPLLDRSTSKEESDLNKFRMRLSEWKRYIGSVDSLHPEGHTFPHEVDCYHRLLVHTYALALRHTGDPGSDSTSALLAAKTRSLLLREVILPYNRLLGQRKEHDSMLGYGRHAEDLFRAWIADSAGVPFEDRPAVLYVFQSVLQYVENSRSYSKSLWKDSRLVWIPLDYALRPEDHDTEDEVDDLLELALGDTFSEANDVHYVLNELMQTELERTIRSAENYHVLWVHDITGINGAGAPDSISYRLSVETYLPTLIARVKDYERTRTLPVFMIFLDQHYYQLHKSRLWLGLLSDPMHHKVKLPPALQSWSQTIRQYQDELRQAVAQSTALQEDAKRYGNAWLENRVCVHVSVTNPSDLSFRSRALIAGFAFAPDNMMRDHRKMAFYDVTEADPSKGEALFTGMGVGEHYLGATWDDRTLLVRGPALLPLKKCARDLLLSQGFGDDDIPEPLKPLEMPADYAQKVEHCRAQGWSASALQVQNVTGYGPKPVDLIKAMLYTCMPNGSHLYAPDALWISPYWGSMLVGAALRGCVVLVVAPSVENAPSSGAPQMSLANELFTRFLIIQDSMRTEIASSGGMFKIGVYHSQLGVGDLTGQIQKMDEMLTQQEDMKRIFPFDSTVLEMLGLVQAKLTEKGFAPHYLAGAAIARKPQLHLKAQFFASAQTIQTVVPLKGWRSIVEKYLDARALQITHEGPQLSAMDLRAGMLDDVARLYAEWLARVPEQDRSKAILYLTVGSHNQNYRSMVMDGEDLFIVGRLWSLVGYLDFVTLLGQVTWLHGQNELEQLLPARTGFWQWFGQFMKLGL